MIVPLFLMGIWLAFKRYWKIGLANCLIAALLWLISIEPVSDYLFRGLESGLEINQAANGDVIILLGGGIYDNAPDLSGVGSPTGEMLLRIVTAARLQKVLNLPIIAASGKPDKHRKAEGPIVRRFLVDIGVPLEKVILEEKSRDTIENARQSKAICDRRGYKKAIVVTSAYHMKRAVISFEKAGLEIQPMPAGFRTGEAIKYSWKDYLPGNYSDTMLALKEYLGAIFYKIAY
ncbi:MAG: YdcF family protein [Nitrospirae bacterium]|nr:YdcF family protein [Nitrospirota bacterium]